MNYITVVNLVGLIINLVGVIILSFSFGKYFRAVDNSFSAMEKSIDSLADTLNNPNQSAVIFQGMENHRILGVKNSKFLTQLGLFLIMIGFLLQVIALII